MRWLVLKAGYRRLPGSLFALLLLALSLHTSPSQAVEKKTLKIAFMINASYPGQQPYAFLAPKGLTFNGAAPNNVAEVPDGHCPFDGDWAQYSWTPDFPWEPAADAASGVNLVHWARSFRVRLKEGV